MTHEFMNYYIRDKNNRPCISIVIIYQNFYSEVDVNHKKDLKEIKEIFYRGVSICSPFLDFPSKNIGRTIAYGRACKAVREWWNNPEALIGYSVNPILRKEIITYLHSLKDSEIIKNILKFGKSSILRFEDLNSFEKNYFISKLFKKIEQKMERINLNI